MPACFDHPESSVPKAVVVLQQCYSLAKGSVELTHTPSAIDHACTGDGQSKSRAHGCDAPDARPEPIYANKGGGDDGVNDWTSAGRANDYHDRGVTTTAKTAGIVSKPVPSPVTLVRPPQPFVDGRSRLSGASWMTQSRSVWFARPAGCMYNRGASMSSLDSLFSDDEDRRQSARGRIESGGQERQQQRGSPTMSFLSLSSRVRET